MLALSLILGPISLNAQYMLSGHITSKADTPLPGVEVYHHQSGKINTTDINGAFTFKNLQEGEHYFTLFSLTLETLTDTLNINQDIKYTFKMKVLSENLDVLDIIAKRKELFTIKQLGDIEGTSIYAGKKTEVIIMDLVKGDLANNNSRQVYAQVSGLNIYEGSDGGLQLNLGGRGLDPNRTSNFNTRQNGYDISADVLGYPENYYTPPSEAISEIRIVRGASSLQYGSQFGGLIDFRLRRIPSYKRLEIISNQTVSSYNSFNSFNYIGVSKGPLSLSTFYNYKKGNGFRNNSEYNAHNFFIAADYRITSNTKLSLEYTHYTYLAKQPGGLTDQQFAAQPSLSTRDRNWFDVNWNLANMILKHRFNKKSVATLSLFGLRASRSSVGFRGQPNNLNENPITALDEQDPTGQYLSPRDLIIGNFNNYGAEFKILNNYQLAQKKAVLLLGAKHFASSNTSTQGPGSNGADADFKLYTNAFPQYANQSKFSFPNLNIALFTENIIYLSDKLSITPGLRWEYIKTVANGEYNQVNFDNAGNPIFSQLLTEDRKIERNFALLGLGINYKKSNSIQFVGNISQNYRSVTFSDIRVVSPTFVVDPDIRDESGLTLDLGIKGRIDKLLSYDMTLYSVLYKDRIGIILNSEANRERKNIGDVIIAGTESLVSIDLARWVAPEARSYSLSAFINAAFTFSQYYASKENNVIGKQVEFIPRTNLKTGLSIGYKKLNITYQYSYLSQQYTDAQNSVAGLLGDSRSGIVGPIPSYGISDLTISYAFKQMSLSGGINNLTNAYYYTRRATGYPGPGIIPSNPRNYYLSVGYRLE